MRILCSTIAVAALALAGLACDDGSSVSTPQLSTADRAFVDRIVAAQQAGDWDEIESLVGFIPRPCTFGERGMSLNPPCRDGEREGDLVDSFAYIGCGSGAWRPGDRERFIDGGPGSSVTSEARFYGALVQPREKFEADSDYHIVFEHEGRDPGTGFWFTVRDRRIVAQMTSCGGIANSFGEDPEFLLKPEDAD